ncbi:hypothetical protein ACJX0J_036970, partial [Zea mays]
GKYVNIFDYSSPSIYCIFASFTLDWKNITDWIVLFQSAHVITTGHSLIGDNTINIIM